MEPLVIYHADCYDGFTAAWIANHYFGGVELHPGKYGEPPPYERAEGRTVFVLDFSYPREEMVRLNEAASTLEVLDHHKTAQANCEGLDFCSFDMERSGAGMAWDRFHPKTKRPMLVECIEDRDLWRFSHPATKSIHAYLTATPMTLDEWSKLFEMPWEHIAEGGDAIRRSIDRYCEKMAEHSTGRILWGKPAQVVNAPYLNCSELCDYLLEGTDEPLEIAVAYFRRSDGRWQFSLRGKPGGTDVSDIARRYGGGGHYSAAGFDVAELPEGLSA